MDETGNKTDLALATPAGAASKGAVTEAQAAAAAQATDESLVEIASLGDERAFAEIFTRYRRRITRLVGRFFRRPDRAEEIVQEVFTKLYFALNYYKKEPNRPFSAWLSSIAINSCYDELRRLRRRPESTLSDVTPDEAGWLATRLKDEQTPDSENHLIARDLAGKLLARLDADDRLILTLLDAEELTVNEIAALTGWSASKVKVRAHRARAALRKVLNEYL